MARCVKNVSSTLLLVLVLIADVSDATEILPEKCEDQYGADLNENFALNRPATQSSVELAQINSAASRAVDGNRNAYFGNHSCSETGLGSPSWTVDLGPEIYVTSVTITTRADGYWREKNNVNITVMNGAEETLCASDFLVHDGATTTYVCEMVKKGTRVKIQNGAQRKMSLCEVEVHGYPFDFYEYEANYALSQAAKMSSLYDLNYAYNAVDGVRNPVLASRSCFHTAYVGGKWWSVDLGVLVHVYAVAITNRDHYPERSANFEIRVGENWMPSKNPACTARQSLDISETRAIFCSRPMQGTNVGILQKVRNYLHFCEVSVHGRMVESVTANEPVCLTPRPLGMEDNTILASQLTASSEYSTALGLHQSRLNSSTSWSALGTDPRPWMQVGFLWPAAVTEIWTQGRHADSNNQYVTSFEFSSSNDYIRYESYKNGDGTTVFPGNSDRDTVVVHRLQPVRVVRIIRIDIVSFNDYPSMRVEFVGCYYKDKGYPLPRALGMQSNAITDDLISSSTEHSPPFRATSARLMGALAWIPTTVDPDPWIQVNFVLTVTIIEILTQGRPHYNQWTKNYKVAFAQQASHFTFYRDETGQEKLFRGSTDRDTVIRNALSPAIRAQFIRIYPKEYQSYRAIRLEFVGYYKDKKSGPLGLEDGRIEDFQMSASSQAQDSSHLPKDARLHHPVGWGAGTSAPDQWLQVDFLRLVKVTEIWTQGKTATNVDEWIASYFVEYSLDSQSFTKFSPYGLELAIDGNVDGGSVVRKPILPAIEARFLRILSIHYWVWISLRLEVIGYYITCAASRDARPLGMESGEISDIQITASSIRGVEHSPGGARLNHENVPPRRGWVAADGDRTAWLQVEFYQTANVIEVQTQRRFSMDIFYNYTLSYGDNGVDFISYEQDDVMKVFKGNDRSGTVSHFLWPAITARFIRINAVSCGQSCALKAEFIGTYEGIHGPELIDPEFVEFENTLTASPSADWNHQPHHGIISKHFYPRAWSPARKERGEFIQIDLLQLTVITSIGFRLAGDKLQDHYTKLILWYGDSKESLKYMKDKTGKLTLFQTSELYTELEKSLLTRYVRFSIASWESRPDFRFQLYGTTVYSEATAGVETGSIKDEQMKSSSHPSDMYPAHQGRLNGPSAWCANPSRMKLYLQIDFSWNFEVHAVATQGKAVGIMEYVTQYQLSSTMDGITWEVYKENQIAKIFTGNTKNCQCTRKNPVRPFLARALRFLPTAWKDAPCMRVEAFGVYKGILRIYARSGVVEGPNETVVTRKCSIKLNGKEVSRKMPGYNIVAANPTTGALISSTSAENPSDVNDLLMNITRDSIVIVATQNVTQRPPNETLHLLESLGAIRLRYSMTSEDLLFLLVGYKGEKRVTWIKEKLGTSKDSIVRIAVPVKLNENEVKPAINELFEKSHNTNETVTDDVTLSGDNAYIFRNITGRCGESDANCEMALSLSMWVKQKPPHFVENIEYAPTSERIDLQYYSQGYKYILLAESRSWDQGHRYCLGIGATLPIYHDQQTRDYLVALKSRLGFVSFYLGLRLQSHTRRYYEWSDGSPAVFVKWRNENEPSGGSEACANEVGDGFNDVSCSSAFKVICQQPIQALLGDDLFPLGMENKLIPDANIAVSSAWDVNVTPGRFARLNRNGKPWCTESTDEEPFIQVDFGRPTRVCAVATQGRGIDITSEKYPTAFWVQSSNDSSDWVTLNHHDKKKYFHGNHDNFGVVINRFPESVFAQFVRINTEKWYGEILCMRIELFGCGAEKDENKEKVNAVLPPETIAENTPKTCFEVLKRGKTSSGVYMIDPDGRGAFPAFCDNESDDGGWTVLHHRFDGSVDFDRIWKEYKWGFGDRYGEHWLGLEYISRLTHAFVMDLRVELATFGGENQFNVYRRFTVGDEAANYMINFAEHAGPGSDSLTTHNNNRFETKYSNVGDKPTVHHGAWWYGSDVKSNLNGKYFESEVNSDESMFWHGLKQKKSLMTARMMIREGVSYIGSALGMKDFYIQDYQITGTGYYYDNFAWKARLDYDSYWLSDVSKYMTVNLISPRRITHIATQGGIDPGNYVKYMSFFAVKFKLLNGTLIDYMENGKIRVFEGNNYDSVIDHTATISNCFKEPVQATEIHIDPTVCHYYCNVRIELYACEDDCSAPVGIQSDLPLDRISSPDSTSPLENLRLFKSTPTWSSDWNSDWGPYIDVKLLELYRVTTIATQGGTYYDDGGIERTCGVKSYFLMYLNERMKWVTYGGKKPKILPGNKNSRTIVKNKLETPFLANAVRLVKWTVKAKPCLKFEIYGCYPDNPSVVIYTDPVVMAGRALTIRGKYRYCPSCDKCPGCIKSLCLRVFDKKYRFASYFAQDCIYHDFSVAVISSVVPGRHRVHLIESEYGKCHQSNPGDSEKFIGHIHVTKEPSSCLELLLSGNTEDGKYRINPDGKGSFEVYCDQTLFGGGWTVFQRRFFGDLSFDVSWSSYKSGFGYRDRDFWLGNDKIHRVTAEEKELSIEMQSANENDMAFVLYKSFQISDEEDGYRLHVADYEPSPAGNCLEDYNGVKFTTHDRDNDEKADGNCAHGSISGFGWWFRDCTRCKLNGKPDASLPTQKQLIYSTWSGSTTLERAAMKVRDRDTVFCGNDYCYYLLKTWNNWFEASEECKKFHSDLVSVRDATENKWIINEILAKLGVDRVHLGLQNTTWTDGSAFDYHNFTGDLDNDLCPVLTRDGSWQYRDCEMKSRILCKRGKWCFRGRCHVYGRTKSTPQNAPEVCHNIGYKLSKIRNGDENDYHKKMIRATTEGSGWQNTFIGLKLDSLRQPYWRDGKKARFTAWKAGEPDQNSKSCTRFSSDGWTDALCNYTVTAYFPLCEKVYEEHPEDCLDLLLSGNTASGIYTISPNGADPLQVYCDQQTYGGGWTLLLRRVDGTLSFEKEWRDYNYGFGDLERNSWLGNINNHRLSTIKQEVLFDLDSLNGDSGFALYKTFQVATGGGNSRYMLTLEDYQESNIGDAMQSNNLMRFSTSDYDHDLDDDTNCADVKSAGWWFSNCSSSCLTCSYVSPGDLAWKTWPSNEAIARAEMKIRTSSVVTCDHQYCYYVKYLKKTWSEALQECRNFNADLVSIHSSDEVDFIRENILEPQAIESVHLGLTASNTWTDGRPTTFSRFTSSLPDTQCTSMLGSGDWATNECNEKKTVLCKRAKHCYKGDCYVFGATLLASSVLSHCEELGYKAAKISSDDEKEYALKLVRESTSDNSEPQTLIGLVVLADGDRVWPDGTLLKYSDWCGIEPNGFPHLGEKHVVFSEVGWYDVPSNSSYPSLCEKAPIIGSCDDVRQKYDRSDSGVYSYNSKDQRTFPVHCDLGAEDGTWLVIQRRVSPTDFATRSWSAYKDGFGTKETNFWLGNKYIHELTWNNPHRLKIVIDTEDFQRYEAIYEDFHLSPEASGFAIQFGTYSGNAGDALSRHRGKPFSASDDDRSGIGCATYHPGGWWFANCLDSNLNGVFTSMSNSLTTIFWRTINANIVKTEMKMQPYPRGSRGNRKKQKQATSLILTSKQNWMDISLQTASQQWTAHVLHPGPFMTHVSVTWEASSYLRYYENGTLVTEVPAVMNEGPSYPNTSLSVFVDLPFQWVHEMKLYNEALTPSDAYNQYASTEVTFDEDELIWTYNQTSNYTWEPRHTCTPSEQTGPCGDHTYHRNTGTFMVTEASRPAYAKDVASIETRTFLDHYKCLSFWYHLYGRCMGTLSVYAEDNEKRVLLTQVSGDSGNVWRLMQVNLDDDGLDITGVFKIIFEAERGKGFQSDAAVDDISLSNGNCKLECNPPCVAGTKCDLKTLQCVYDGIYDHLWSMDSLPITDDKAAFTDNIHHHGTISVSPGAIDTAVQCAGGYVELGVFEDKCLVGKCYPEYTLSLWLKYEVIPNSYVYLMSFGERLQIAHISDYAPKDYLNVFAYVGLRKCEFKIFAPAEVWNHFIFAVSDDNFTMYVNGRQVENTTWNCPAQIIGPWSYNPLRIGTSYGTMYFSGSRYRKFAADDVRLLLDALSTYDTLEYYKTITGYDQTIWFKANFTTIPWREELSDDESDFYRSMSQFVSDKVNATLWSRSYIKDIYVRKFMDVGVTSAEVYITYEEVSYYDILLLEEAIYVNNTFDGLQVNGTEIDSNSVPVYRPDYQITVVAVNNTCFSVSWPPIYRENVHSIFRGYKLLYAQTANSSYTEYSPIIIYANYTETLLTGLVQVTNYTVRVLAFGLSGDGLISEPVITSTLDGEVVESPNMTLANVSSTSLYVNWTLLPISNDDYHQLFGYKLFYWKESEESKVFNMTLATNKSEILFESLEKWTTYCFSIAGFNMAGSGPNDTQCSRTLEDVPENPPSNVTAAQVTTSSILLEWQRPAVVPGMLRYYNISYRVLNISDSEVVELSVPGSATSYLIDDLTGLMLCEINITAVTIDAGPVETVRAMTLEGLPLAAVNISLVNVSSTAFSVNWTELPWELHNGILLGYRVVFMENDPSSIPFAIQNFSPDEFYKPMVNMSKWSIYCATVAAYTAIGNGPWCEPECTRTFEDVPENPPSNVTAAQVTTSSILLEWQRPAVVPGMLRYYNISYRVLNISDSEVVELSVPGSATSYLIDGLTGLMLCEINITAVTIDAGPVETVRAMTLEGVPLAAVNLSLVNVSSTAFSVNWTELPWELHNGILLGYRVYIAKEDSATGTFTVPTMQTFTPDQFEKLMVNMSKWTTYCAEVTAFTATGNGPRSERECTRTFEDAPEEPPRNFIAVEVNVTAIKVEWEPPPRASVPGIIRLYNFTCRNLNYTNENLTELEFGANNGLVVIENLHGLTLYEINITAITILPGPWQTLFVLTQEGVPVITPPNVEWFNLTSTSIKSTWDLIPPHLLNGILMGYSLSLWKESDPQNITNVIVTEETKLFSWLEKWTTYCGHVAAFTRIGEGPRSQVECIRTSEDEPEVPPQNLNGTNTTWTSFLLSWDAIGQEFIPGILRTYRVSYEIQDAGFNQAYDGSISVDSSDTSVNLTGLIGLTNYKITVSGVTIKDGPPVEVFLQTHEGVPTSPPEEIVPTEVTPTTISLSWKDIFLPERHGIVKGYKVTYKKLERRTRREAEEKTLTFDANVHTAFMYKLDPYTNYSITVAGFTSKGMGVEKHFLIETKQGVPDVAPKNSYGVNFTGPTTIFIGWGSLNTEELQGVLAGYEVRYRKFSVADEILKKASPEETKVIYSDINGAKLTGLETYTTYQVRVAAIGGGGRGTFTSILYIATCRCHKVLTTNYWNFQPYTNISRRSSNWGFFPHLLDMVTLSCCQNCLEHGTSEVDYFHDGVGNPSERYSDIGVKRAVDLRTDFTFPIYGYNGQTQFMKYYGFATVVDVVGTVFFTIKPDYSLTQAGVLLDAVLTIMPFLALAVIFAYIAGVVMWALECGHNEDEFPSRFITGAASGFWWAYVTMTTVGYGDKTARTVAGRVFAVIWVLTGLCICSLLIGTIATAFTSSTTPPDPEDIMIYGSNVAALQNSPDHKLGLRRNAKMNNDSRRSYQSLDELRSILLSGAVDGILVDAYVADARKELFSPFMIKKIIDLTSTYGVVMGTDAQKLRKCFSQFWKVNAAVRSNFIRENSNPVKVTELSTAEQMGESYNPQSALYQISLYSCAVALIVLCFCGCIYEIIRRKRKSTKVDCEQDSTATPGDFRSEVAQVSESLIKNISELRNRQKEELIAFLKSQRHHTNENHDGDNDTS